MRRWGKRWGREENASWTVNTTRVGTRGWERTATWTLSRTLSLYPRAVERTTYFLFQVKLESNFASVVFAIMVLEGLGRSLDPKLDILEAARPFLLKGLVSSPWLWLWVCCGLHLIWELKATPNSLSWGSWNIYKSECVEGRPLFFTLIGFRHLFKQLWVIWGSKGREGSYPFSCRSWAWWETLFQGKGSVEEDK